MTTGSCRSRRTAHLATSADGCHDCKKIHAQVREVKGGICTVKYDGPPPIAMGVKVRWSLGTQCHLSQHLPFVTWSLKLHSY